MSYGARELAKDLRDLLARPVRNEQDLKAWYAAARLVQERIRSVPKLANEIPESVWHFLIDADTRLKDSRYKELQKQQIWSVIAHLEQGIL